MRSDFPAGRGGDGTSMGRNLYETGIFGKLPKGRKRIRESDSSKFRTVRMKGRQQAGADASARGSCRTAGPGRNRFLWLYAIIRRRIRLSILFPAEICPAAILSDRDSRRIRNTDRKKIRPNRTKQTRKHPVGIFRQGVCIIQKTNRDVPAKPPCGRLSAGHRAVPTKRSATGKSNPPGTLSADPSGIRLRPAYMPAVPGLSPTTTTASRRNTIRPRPIDPGRPATAILPNPGAGPKKPGGASPIFVR